MRNHVEFRQVASTRGQCVTHECRQMLAGEFMHAFAIHAKFEARA